MGYNCVTSRKVACSIPHGVTGIVNSNEFHSIVQRNFRSLLQVITPKLAARIDGDFRNLVGNVTLLAEILNQYLPYAKMSDMLLSATFDGRIRVKIITISFIPLLVSRKLFSYGDSKQNTQTHRRATHNSANV
jgi:hypothetical protein